MATADDTHSPGPEEIMAYLDGEGTVAERSVIEIHLAQCASCQVVMSEQRRLSDDVRAWRTAPAPPSLHAPPLPHRRIAGMRIPRWRPSRLATAALAAAAAVVLVVEANLWFGPAAYMARQRVMTFEMPESTESETAADTAAAQPLDRLAGRVSGRPDQAPSPSALVAAPETLAATVPQGPQGQNGARKPAIVRTATLRMVAKDLGAVRPAVDAFVAAAGGFADYMTANSEPGAPRTLHSTLRVPSDRLAQVLAGLRRLGQVVEDTQGSEDVTDQRVDLEARLANARSTESRLADLLRNRTARLSDVLEVERELARVRLDIERLDAENTNIGRRVSYATLILSVVEERKAGLAPGRLSLASRFRVAAADGMDLAMESVFWAILTAMRAGPSVILWVIVFGAPALIVRRAWRARMRRSL